MKNILNLRRRVIQNSLVIATTVVTCIALHADEQSGQITAPDQSASQGGPASGQAGKSDQHVEKFVQKAMASGQMEVQMAQLGQQQAQNQQVKALAAAMVRDHSQANQKLQQIASTKNIMQDKHGDHQKHQQHLDKLKSQSGAEFDKEFVRMAIKGHKKNIQAFENAQNQITDQELKSFISETLPKLRQHYQMAQAAAPSVGVDEASIVADVDVDSDSSAVGGAAKAESGPRERSPIVPPDQSTNPDRPRSSLDGATDTDPSGTINQNSPSIEADAQVGDRDLSASADVDVDSDASVEADVDAEKNGKIFEKGDGKVLGLSTDKDDGKFLGIIPNPRKDKDADVEADVDVETDDEAIGGSATVESGSSEKKNQ